MNPQIHNCPRSQPASRGNVGPWPRARILPLRPGSPNPAHNDAVARIPPLSRHRRRRALASNFPSPGPVSAMAAVMVRLKGQGLFRSAVAVSRHMSSSTKSIDLNSEVALQEARTWDEGVSSEFSTTSLSEIFKVID